MCPEKMSSLGGPTFEKNKNKKWLTPGWERLGEKTKFKLCYSRIIESATLI